MSDWARVALVTTYLLNIVILFVLCLVDGTPWLLAVVFPMNLVLVAAVVILEEIRMFDDAASTRKLHGERLLAREKQSGEASK